MPPPNPENLRKKTQFSPPENNPTPTALRRPPREGEKCAACAAMWNAASAARFAGALPPHPQSRRRRLGKQGRPTAFSCSLALSVGSLPASQGGIRKRPADVYKASPLTVFQLRRLPQFSRPKTKTAVKRSILR